MDRKTCVKWGITTKQAAEIYGEKNIIHKQKKNRRPKTYLAEEQKK